MRLTPRERVLLAIKHEEPDRIPIDFGGVASSICEIVPPLTRPNPCYGYSALTRHLGLGVPNLRLFKEVLAPDTSLTLDAIDTRILDRFSVDFRNVMVGTPSPKVLADGSFFDFWGIKWTPAGSQFWYSSPLKDKQSPRDVEEYAWPDLNDPVFVQGKEKEARQLHEETDYFVHGCGLTPLFFIYVYLAGFERWLTDPYRNPEFYEALVGKIFEIESAVNERFFGLVRDYVDSAWCVDDFGSQGGPLMSIQHFRRYCKPWIMAMIDKIRKQAPHVKMFLHSCGSNYGLIGDYAEAGIDVWQTVQLRARNQEPERLKKEYGDKICFMGGVDAQQLLPFGSPDQIRSEVKKTITVLAPGGGYILGPTHNIVANTPPENVVAMYEAGIEFGAYPIV